MLKINRSKLKSFTLMEIIVTIIILGILVTLAFTYYKSVIQQQHDKEAIANLKVILAAEKLKQLETGSFVSCTCNSDTTCNDQINGCNAKLHLNLTAKNWSYTVDSTIEGDCLAMADRKFNGSYFYVLTNKDPDGEPNRHGPYGQ